MWELATDEALNKLVRTASDGFQYVGSLQGVSAHELALQLLCLFPLLPASPRGEQPLQQPSDALCPAALPIRMRTYKHTWTQKHRACCCWVPRWLQLFGHS